MSAKGLKEKLAELLKRLSDYRSKIEAEKRDWTDEETAYFDQGIVDKLALEKQIKDAERRELNLDTFKSDEDEKEKFEETRKSHDLKNDDPNRPLTSRERSRALRAWLLGDKRSYNYFGQEGDLAFMKRAGIEMKQNELTMHMHRGFSESGEELGPPQSQLEVRQQAEMRSKMTAEQRATLIAGTTTLGGFTVPDEMMKPLEEALLFWGGMREVATVFTTATGADMPIPMVNDTTNKAVVLAEDTAVAEQAMAFTQLVMKAWKYSSKLVPISVELLQDSATNMPAYIGRAIGERFGRGTNEHFTTGDGSSKPFGITVDAVNSTFTFSLGTPNFQTLNSLIHSVDIAYRRQDAKFMMHDSTFGILAGLKDSAGLPIYRASLADNTPDRLLGYPVVINNDMPSTSTGRGVIFGDLKKYLIRDTAGITLLRLDERYAEFHRVAFLAFLRTDGKLLNAGTNPVKYAALAA